jgi:hypothetical protein
MKKILALIILSISTFSYGQVESLETLPDIINKPGTSNTDPSFNLKQDLLCFYRESKNERAIMISRKLSTGEWSEPYSAIKFPSHRSKGFLNGAKINGTGTRIYFGFKSDIYFSEHVGGNKWAPALRIDEPVSTSLEENSPSITSDEQTIAFIRNIRSTDQLDWIETPFISNKNDSLGWSNPKPLLIKDFTAPTEELIITQTKDLIIFAAATKTAFHNYYSTIHDSIYTGTKEINFSSGRIRWISDDYLTGLAETFLNPKMIVKINFKPSGFNNLSVTKANSVTMRAEELNEQNTTSVKPTGKYYGLLIGVSNYLDPGLNLDKPVKDANTLSEILFMKYDFNRENIKVLQNPTRQEILSELYKLRSIITSNDNLLIFFAGHGYWDKNVNQGYWWPRDAREHDPSFWLSNSDLREQIRGIKSGHTLLISDACFSGGIFKARGKDDLSIAPINIQLLYKTKSRRAITSGNFSTVPDQSIFFDYLTNRLLENNEQYLPSQSLFNSLKIAVINNSLNIPQEGVISDSGDEGGDFIFIKKMD